MKGFIHDASAIGQTFIEPQEVFEANNYLRNLFSMERNIRILKIHRFIGPDISSIKEALNYLGQLILSELKPNLL